jgi:hypothetical protein
MEQEHLLAEQGVLGQESAMRAEQVAERGKQGCHGFTEHRARVPTDEEQERSNLDLTAMRQHLTCKPAVEGRPFPLLPS